MITVRFTDDDSMDETRQEFLEMAIREVGLEPDTITRTGEGEFRINAELTEQDQETIREALGWVDFHEVEFER